MKLNIGESKKNVLVLMTGTSIGQLIPIAISPILTRIYTPEDFGVFAIFLAISGVFGSIISLRYELAIMLPETEEDAIHVFVLGFIITLVFSLLLFLIVLIFNTLIVEGLGNEKIRLWLYFIPLEVFLFGVFNLFNYFNTRVKNYKLISKSVISKSLSIMSVQLVLGTILKGAFGLIIGRLFSSIVACFVMIKGCFIIKEINKSLSIKKLFPLGKKYKRFPIYSMPAVLCNTLSSHFTDILISSIYSVSTLGFYSLLQRILGVPSSLIGGAIGQVFFQEAAVEKKETGKATNSFNSVVLKLSLIGIPIFTILYFIIKKVVVVFFGQSWAIVGDYAQILIPLFCIRFIVTSVTTVNSIFERQKVSLVWQIILLILMVLLIFIAKYNNLSFEVYLRMMMIVISIHYLMLFLILKRISSKGYLFINN